MTTELLRRYGEKGRQSFGTEKELFLFQNGLQREERITSGVSD